MQKRKSYLKTQHLFKVGFRTTKSPSKTQIFEWIWRFKKHGTVTNLNMKTKFRYMHSGKPIRWGPLKVLKASARGQAEARCRWRWWPLKTSSLSYLFILGKNDFLHTCKDGSNKLQNVGLVFIFPQKNLLMVFQIFEKIPAPDIVYFFKRTLIVVVF